ncbi:MAG: LD-carboxypeptidase [Sphingobacteriia bacterium]|nr:LD-carboxypeptidase [Sphingobacteriia bacterium]
MTLNSTFLPAPLKHNDIVEIIAPASAGFSQENLKKASDFIESINLRPSINLEIVGNNLPYHSNTDEIRAEQLIKALYSTDSKAIWCMRGGYGSAKLIKYIDNYIKDHGLPNTPKWLIGFSDITILHIYLNQKFGWLTLHAPVLNSVIEKDLKQEDIVLTEKIIFGQIPNFTLTLEAFNYIALNNKEDIKGVITGGNLCVIDKTIGTGYEIETNNKILLLEDIGEKGYSIDRMLEHLKDAGLLNNILALIYADFTDSDKNLEYALKSFAKKQTFPVYKCNNIGHGKINYPFLVGSTSEITYSTKENPSILLNYL